MGAACWKAAVSNENQIPVVNSEFEVATVNGNHNPVEENVSQSQRNLSAKAAKRNTSILRINEKIACGNEEAAKINQLPAKNNLLNENNCSVVDSEFEVVTVNGNHNPKEESASQSQRNLSTKAAKRKKPILRINGETVCGNEEAGKKYQLPAKTNQLNENNCSVTVVQSDEQCSTNDTETEDSLRRRSRRIAEILAIHVRASSDRYKKPCFEENKQQNLQDPEDKAENRKKWEDSKISKRRFAVSYTDSERAEIVRRICQTFENSSFNRGQRDIKPNPLHLENCKEIQIPGCNKHKIKRFSLPNLNSGCLYITNSGSENVRVSDPLPEAIKVHHQLYNTISNPSLQSGGTVIFEELSKRVSLPNIYNKDTIFVDLPDDFIPPPVSPEPVARPSSFRSLSREGLSGGGLVEEDHSKKISWTELFSSKEHLHVNNSFESYHTSGGGLLPEEHIIHSDILSQTVRWELKPTSSRESNLEE